jgi:hypothetical protein
MGGGAIGGRGMSGSDWMTVASGIALWTIVALASSSAPSISTVNGMAPKRSSCPERSGLSTTRWLSTNVPFALP